MGTAEIELQNIIIHSHIITYGHAANPQITEQIREEIETMWNEPRTVVTIEEKIIVSFSILRLLVCHSLQILIFIRTWIHEIIISDLKNL
jgi:hypothetical protein